jgi:hypothetical protein
VVPKVNPHAIRRDRAAELELLGRILAEFGICDLSPLYRAAAQCRAGVNADRWGYSVANLILRLPHGLRGIRPKLATDIHHILDVVVEGTCEAEDYAGDPFCALAVDIVARGALGKQSLVCSWHLDRHLLTVAPEEGEAKGTGEHPTESSETHPLYHFQFGGRAMTGMIDTGSASLGDVLLLEPPRLVHPPLDAVLAVDFILGNFYPADRQRLWTDGRYVGLVNAAQLRCWKPYANLCARSWEPEPATGWKPRDLWPHLPEVRPS